MTQLLVIEFNRSAIKRVKYRKSLLKVALIQYKRIGNIKSMQNNS